MSSFRFMSARIRIGVALVCALCIGTGFATAQQRIAPISRAVLPVPEAIDALNAITTKQQKQIDALTASSASQQAQITTLTRDLQSAQAELQKMKTTSVRPAGPSFNAGGIVRSSWDSLPGETIIPFRLGTPGHMVECYAHKSRFGKIPAEALFEYSRNGGGGAISKAGFNSIPGNAMLKYYTLNGDPSGG